MSTFGPMVSQFVVGIIWLMANRSHAQSTYSFSGADDMAFLCQSELLYLLDNPMQSSKTIENIHHDSSALDRMSGARRGIWTRVATLGG